jgi:hypothetical protein
LPGSSSAVGGGARSGGFPLHRLGTGCLGHEGLV